MLDEIKDCIKKKMNKKQIAKHLGISQSTLDYRMSKTKYKTFVEYKKKLERDEYQELGWEMLELISQGKEMQDIKKQLNLSEMKVKAVLNFYGYEGYMEARKDLYYYSLGYTIKNADYESKGEMMKDLGIYKYMLDEIAVMHGERDGEAFCRKYIDFAPDF